MRAEDPRAPPALRNATAASIQRLGLQLEPVFDPRPFLRRTEVHRGLLPRAAFPNGWEGPQSGPIPARERAATLAVLVQELSSRCQAPPIAVPPRGRDRRRDRSPPRVPNPG